MIYTEAYWGHCKKNKKSKKIKSHEKKRLTNTKYGQLMHTVTRQYNFTHDNTAVTRDSEH